MDLAIVEPTGQATQIGVTLTSIDATAICILFAAVVPQRNKSTVEVAEWREVETRGIDFTPIQDVTKLAHLDWSPWFPE